MRRHADAVRGILIACVLSVVHAVFPVPASAQPASGATPSLLTRWAADVKPDAPLPEYPRPQLVRDRWLNLNGRWEFEPVSSGQPLGEPPNGRSLSRRIVVPFPMESRLSGIAERHERAWYRRTFAIPEQWANRGGRIILHFGAVDWESTVWVNGVEVGAHRGGYDAFSFDVTDAVRRAPGEINELIVGVWDPTDAGEQPRGKQVRDPGGIWYTPHSGIWQTVWIESVPDAYVSSIRVESDEPEGIFRVRVDAARGNERDTVTVNLLDGGELRTRNSGPIGAWIELRPRDPKRWSPESPFLYGVEVQYYSNARLVETVRSYAGLRSVSLGKDDKGVTRILLNGKPYFHVGPLDQGYWPDGISTAPTDEALRWDIEFTKRLGFNATRKHVKVEPARWYYWADTLGLLVWQDMPSGGTYIGPNDPDVVRTPESAAIYERELKAMIDGLRHHPSIIMWVVFNEGWGQFDTPRIVELARTLDPTRLINNASGWTDRGVGDVIDMHHYPPPRSPRPEPSRAAVLGEFGGLGLPVEGHMWKPDVWGYQVMADSERLTSRYEQFLKEAYALRDAAGLSAAIYTQIVDVEIEANGLATYDRAVTKVDVDRVSAVNRGDFSRMPPPPVITPVVPTSEKSAQTWRWTTTDPGDGWERPDFDDSSWTSGPGGFGAEGTPGAVIGTTWNSGTDGGSIWLRRSFELPAGVSIGLRSPHLRIHHDEDCAVYINGVLAIELGGYTTDYELFPIRPDALAAIKPGVNTLAIRCRQTRGGQFIDAGIVDVVPVK